MTFLKTCWSCCGWLGQPPKFVLLSHLFIGGWELKFRVPYSSPSPIKKIFRNQIANSLFSCSCVQLCNTMGCSTPGFPLLHYPRCAQIHVHWNWVMASNRLILCRPVTLSHSHHQGWPEYCSSSIRASSANLTHPACTGLHCTLAPTLSPRWGLPSGCPWSSLLRVGSL